MHTSYFSVAVAEAACRHYVRLASEHAALSQSAQHHEGEENADHPGEVEELESISRYAAMLCLLCLCLCVCVYVFMFWLLAVDGLACTF